MTRLNREIEKPLATRTVELVRALQLLSDSLEHLRRGDSWHVIALSGQLRALLSEKSRRAVPLLIHIATEFERDLKVFGLPDLSQRALPEGVRDKTVLHAPGLLFSSERQNPDQIEMSFPEVLDLQVLLYQGNHHTVRDLIERYANSLGGAHYSRQLPQDFSELLDFRFMNRDPIVNVLVQIGEATLAAGRELLKFATDFEIHLLLCLPAQSSEGLSNVNMIFDARYEGTAMRLTLAVDKLLTPVFCVSGLQGIAARVRSDRLIDWNELKHLHASLAIQADLSTNLELVVDGEVVGRSNVREPIFVLSNLLQYDVYYNRAVDGPPQQLSYAMGDVTIGSKASPYNHAKLMLYMSEKREHPEFRAVLYTPKSYAHAAKGTTDLSMTGSVRHVKLSDLLSGEPDVGNQPDAAEVTTD